MTYWHIQLHPNDINWGREQELLEQKSLIGIGDYWKAGESQIRDFIKTIQVGDIVVVRCGKKPIALVEVKSDSMDNLENDISELDWFRYRREVKVLDFFNKSKLDSADRLVNDFPSTQKTLTRSVDKNTPTHQYIESWHKSLFPELYQTEDSLKLNKVKIKKHRVFENFEIDFTDEGRPLPIIVVAGINGTGKTTLLEYIDNFLQYSHATDRSEIEYTRYNQKTQSSQYEILSRTDLYDVRRDRKEKSLKAKFFEDHIIYLPTGTYIKDTAQFLSEYIESIIHQEDLQPSKVHERVRKYIQKLFDDLGLLIEFDRRDKDGNLFFRNQKGEDFSIEQLSTGEKTLLSKVLFLYVKNIENRTIMIDEPELSLHPKWQNRVLKLYENFAKKNNCQIIIATHSPHIIGSTKPESIRLLVKENEQIQVVDEFSQSYGLEFSRILTDIMDVEYLRVPEVGEKLATIKNMIAQNSFDTEQFQEKWQELEDTLGQNHLDLKLLKLEIASRKKRVQN